MATALSNRGVNRFAHTPKQTPPAAGHSSSRTTTFGKKRIKSVQFSEFSGAQFKLKHCPHEGRLWRDDELQLTLVIGWGCG